MPKQQTLAKTVSLEGPGLFSPAEATVTLRPADIDRGIVFVRTDQNNTEIPAVVANVVKRDRRTSLQVGEVSIDTCEHCLSAIAAAGLDNAIIEITGPELPMVDGSAKPYYDLIQKAGLVEQEAEREVFVVKEPITLKHDSAMISILPSDEPGMEVVYDLRYSQCDAIGNQVSRFHLHQEDYGQLIAPARTFLLEEEAQLARQAGIGSHLTEDTVLVIGENGPLGNNELRFADEPVRHKVLDLIGDLYLLGAQIQGRVIAHRSGHSLNHALVREIISRWTRRRRTGLSKAVIDIRGLMRMMPHRYPMLLVDRVVEIVGEKRAIGIKNVTMNEPFFQGHYPGTPIMPGVLIVEAMAQLSGVLIGQKIDNMGKLAVLLSLDGVKLRKPVTPGDQLVLEAETVKLRARIAHMNCRAYVGEELAAEAEVKFMLVDDDAQS